MFDVGGRESADIVPRKRGYIVDISTVSRRSGP